MVAFPKPRPKLLDKRKAKASKASDWRKVRAVVMARDGHRCRACGLTNGLDAHHVVARSLGGKDKATNLIALCRPCHQSVHGHVLLLHGGTARTVMFEWVR